MGNKFPPRFGTGIWASLRRGVSNGCEPVNCMYHRTIGGFPAPSGGRSIRRWVLLVAVLALTSAFASASWGPAQAQATCGGVPSANSGLIGDCNTLLSLKDTQPNLASLNWSEDTEITYWESITVSGSPQRVTGLTLRSLSLTGAIPSELSGLRALDLSDNQFSGSIPSGLGDLSNLETLNLSKNQLAGAIPSGLGDLSNLETLNLSKNQLAGAIPSELGRLNSLGTLDLSTNQLHGVIPSELGDLSGLRTLNLSRNGLSGPIPAGLGGLSSLVTLNLSNNSLGGSIPSKLGNLSNLTGLNLSYNELDWKIPEELNQLDNLERVWLNENLGLIGPAHLDFTGLSEAHLGYMEEETWAVADFSSATTWSLSGYDSGKFAITPAGVLKFSAAPDFEVPSSANSSNDYFVEVTASVGVAQKTARIHVNVMDRDFALSVSPVEVSEGVESATSIEVTATRDGVTTLNNAATVTLSLSGTATGSDVDYIAAVPSMTILAGEATGTATLSITPKNDVIVEGEETIRVEGAVDVFTVSPAWITIQDYGDAGTLSLSVSSTNVAEVKEGPEDPDTWSTVTVTLSHAIGPEVTVAWSVTPDSATSDDYCAYSGTLDDDGTCPVTVDGGGTYSDTLTFPAGSAANSTKSFTIVVEDDNLSEVAESFTVMLDTVTGDISDLISLNDQAKLAELTIAKSDPIIVTLSGASSVDEGESVTYTVSLSPDGVTPTADLTVHYATIPAVSGDYEGVSGTREFTSSDTAAETVTVQTTGDSIAEGDETFSFSLTNVTGGGGPASSLGSPITTTIDDDDAEPTAITLSVSPDEVSEGDGSARTVTITATLDGDSTRASTTTVALSLSGTATGSGTDYTAVVPDPFEMTIPARAPTGTATLSITPTDDEIVEGEETIRVEGTASGFTVSSAEITINDDDSRPSLGSSVNQWPEFDEGVSATRTVVENSEVETAIGEPVRASDLDDDALEYWLWGTDQASFDVNSTGQLSSKTVLDWEVKNEYSLRMRVRDVSGGFDEIRITIIVGNVDEPPERTAAPDVEDCTHSVLIMNWGTPDNQGPEITGYDVRYREEGGGFQDSGYDGNGTSLTLENLRPKTAYEVQVRAVNAEGTGVWSESGRCVTKAKESTDTSPDNTKPKNTPTPTPEPTPMPEPPATHTLTTALVPTSPAVPMALFPAIPTPQFNLVISEAPRATAEPEPLPTPYPVSTSDDILRPTPTVEPVPSTTAEPDDSTTAEPDDGFPWWVLLAVMLGAIGGSAALVRRLLEQGRGRSLRGGGRPPGTVIGKVSMVIVGWARSLTGSIRTVARISRRNG